MTLALLWANPWVRRAALVVALFGAALLIRQHYINVGKEAGKAEAAQQQASGIETHRAADRDTATENIAAIQIKIDALAQSAAQDRQLILNIVSQRQQAATQVAGMTPNQVQELINQALQRPANSTAPYSTQDQQQIASCFSQLPLCNKQVTQLESESAKLSDQIDQHQQKYGVLVDYTVSLERDYTDLWNVNSKPHRKPWCLWLCKRAPQIKQPNPALLNRPK